MSSEKNENISLPKELINAIQDAIDTLDEGLEKELMKKELSELQKEPDKVIPKSRYSPENKNIINTKIDKISHDELIKIFNSVLDSCPFCVNVNIFNDMHTVRRRKNQQHKDYFKNKLFDIECKLGVFENIPKNKIYNVIEDFLVVIEDYNNSKRFKKENSKMLQKKSYNQRKKDIKVIENYQSMIYDYSSDNSWNDDPAFTIQSDTLDNIYQLNKMLLEELNTREYNILDVYRYEGTRLYDSSKKKVKRFFIELKKEYVIHTLYAKEMVDIL